MRVPIQHALLRHQLVLGGDRRCVLTTFLILGAMCYATRDFLMILLFIALGGAALLGLRELARQDAWIVPIIMRCRRTVGYAPNRPLIDSTTRPVR